tara:strand:- start:144 stop:374 length:231 start_codon:yes stop_codon:yes gene_type:complete
MLKLFFTLFLYFVSIGTAHAYIDPGTGSIILQAVLGFIAITLTGASFYWNKFKSFFKKKFKKEKNNEIKITEDKKD